MSNDSLYRLSIKCLILTDDQRVLVVKEVGRTGWDLPGGGVDHGETIKVAIARELKEEVGFEGAFTYKVVTMEDPKQLRPRDIWQVRVIVQVFPEEFNFTVGPEADEVLFLPVNTFKDTQIRNEQRIYAYATLVKNA